MRPAHTSRCTEPSPLSTPAPSRVGQLRLRLALIWGRGRAGCVCVCSDYKRRGGRGPQGLSGSEPLGLPQLEYPCSPVLGEAGGEVSKCTGEVQALSYAKPCLLPCHALGRESSFTGSEQAAGGTRREWGFVEWVGPCQRQERLGQQYLMVVEVSVCASPCDKFCTL